VNDPWGKRKPPSRNDPWGVVKPSHGNGPWGEFQQLKTVVSNSDEHFVKMVKENVLKIGSILELDNTGDPKNIRIFLRDKSFTENNVIDIAKIDLSHLGSLIPNTTRIISMEISAKDSREIALITLDL